MKKRVLLLSLLAVNLLANDKPPHLSGILQYMNTLVETPSQKYTQIKKSDSHFKVGVDTYISSSYNIANIPLSYVYNDMVGVSVYIPYIEAKNSNFDSNGIGDTTYEISFNAGTFDSDIPQENNIFGIRYTDATGERTDGLGVGSSSFGIFWDTNAIIGEWTLYGSLLWTYYLDDINDGKYTYTPGGEDIFWIGASHECLLTDKINTTAKLNWQYKMEDETINGYNVNGTSYNMIDLTIEWESEKIVEELPIRAGIKIPIWDSNVVDNEFMFFVGVSKLF